jgi:hypothetical protein
MNENAQWQMIKDSVLFAKKKSILAACMPLTKVISQETIKIKILWNKLFFIATGNWQLICAIAY